ncbi:MaoC family dehydratase [Desulfosporosinus fructosivorans]|uniref:MaoC family dehydratase n=2 Tax=Desulfosporosinus fructosivorans TaxID=2018669 RepID=A0A4Z0R727_9FIRM|nr:MaoC family dehydratase [Desulfosporosinus fructosivorans]
MWCGLTGDMNPVHLDREYCKTTRFKDIIVPGIYVLGFVSATLSKLAIGGIYASQDIRFMQPVYLDDTITATSTIIDKLEAKHMLKFLTHCVNQKGETVMDGEALLFIQRTRSYPSAIDHVLEKG